MDGTVGISFVLGATLAASYKTSMNTVTNNVDQIKGKVKSLLKTQSEIGNAMSSRSINGVTADLKKMFDSYQDINHEVSLLSKQMTTLEGINSNKEAFKSQLSSLQATAISSLAISGIVSEANDLKRAQGEIKSLGIGAEGINSITTAARNFSNQFAGTTTPEFIRASYDIKSGISSLSDEGVAKFTEMAAMTAKATKSTVADMTKLMALGYGIFRTEFTSDEQFATQFSNAISGAVQAFRTDGPDLIQGISNLGATATSMGVSLSEQLAIIGMSKGAFNSASEAATGYRAFLQGVGKAQSELGLTFTDSEGKMLPMVDILEKLKAKYGDSLSTVAVQDEIKKAFGSSEAVKTISALINNTNALSDAQQSLNDHMATGTITSEMAKAMDEGEDVTIVLNKMKNLLGQTGLLILPAVKIATTGIGLIVMGLSFLSDKLSFILTPLASVAAGFFALFLIMKGYSLMKLGVIIVKDTLAMYTLGVRAFFASKGIHTLTLSNVKLIAGLTLSTIKMKAISIATAIYGTVTKVASVGIGILSTAFRTLTVAMMANPIGLIIGGVIALGAGAMYSALSLELTTVTVSASSYTDNTDSGLGVYGKAGVKFGFGHQKRYLLDAGVEYTSRFMDYNLSTLSVRIGVGYMF